MYLGTLKTTKSANAGTKSRASYFFRNVAWKPSCWICQMSNYKITFLIHMLHFFSLNACLCDYNYVLLSYDSSNAKLALWKVFQEVPN